MSMSTHVKGIIPPDETWLKMKVIYDNCIDADIEVPDKVMEFFDYEEPDNSGVVIDLSTKQYSNICREWSDDMSSGYELDVKDIPEGVRTLRFYNSW